MPNPEYVAALALRTNTAFTELARERYALCRYFSAEITDNLRHAPAMKDNSSLPVDRIHATIHANAAAELHLADKTGTIYTVSKQGSSLRELITAINDHVLTPLGAKTINYKKSAEAVKSLADAMKPAVRDAYPIIGNGRA